MNNAKAATGDGDAVVSFDATLGFLIAVDGDAFRVIRQFSHRRLKKLT